MGAPPEQTSRRAEHGPGTAEAQGCREELRPGTARPCRRKGRLTRLPAGAAGRSRPGRHPPAIPGPFERVVNATRTADAHDRQVGDGQVGDGQDRQADAEVRQDETPGGFRKSKRAVCSPPSGCIPGFAGGCCTHAVCAISQAQHFSVVVARLLRYRFACVATSARRHALRPDRRRSHPRYPRRRHFLLLARAKVFTAQT